MSTPAARALRVALRGESILTSPRFNKGTAFTTRERTAFGLTGREPWRINTLEEQCQRAYDQLSTRDTPIRKNTFLQSLKDQNWVLYYGLIGRHLKELIPIIYTPTQADAIANYSHLFRRSEGMFLTFPNQDTMEEDFLEQTKGRDLQLFVCSDAEAILGIGDQGVGITTAKSAIYTLLAGIDPAKALSVTLDVGTDNEGLLKDDLYVGWPNNRVRGKAYDDFIDKFVQLIRKYHPHSLLHFEDFGVNNAKRLLDLYRDKHSVFNDDIQGTGAVTLAALMAAIGVTKSKLSEQRILVYGAGTAGLGITRQLRDAMVQLDGLSEADANKQFFLLDRYGLVKESLGPKVRGDLREYVRPDAEWEGVPTNDKGEVELLNVVRHVKPTVIVGCSTRGGAFTEDVIREMAKGTDRPIIFPLSNPSRLAEVDPTDANVWTDGKALMASGSPFPPCHNPRGGKDYIVAECNNALIYPGLGYGAMITQARSLSDSMIIAGARRLASLSPALSDPDNALLPDFTDAREVNTQVAVAVAEQAIEEGLADVPWKKNEVHERIVSGMWQPVYADFEYDLNGLKA
ncbi:uncharacterized protein B0H18DRAFT_878510 [Fomitopsis serialis]|uniref:uncharacterized protein n=1 Tax=Fomitopsis serialis TaxID=139415 RepID=UPI0020085EDE|nr:uncharacterized protein B0H18DRAFT_878510 [Neoantrodia serialis]KAH9923681.1 hypothetical protein B0H18DRAFT_878510 [Neoantrodia serialis]